MAKCILHTTKFSLGKISSMAHTSYCDKNFTKFNLFGEERGRHNNTAMRRLYVCKLRHPTKHE